MMQQTKSSCKLKNNMIAGLLVSLNLFTILHFGLFQRSLTLPDILDHLRSTEYFSVFDLDSGNNKVSIDEKPQHDRCTVGEDS